ncbi:recombinase family protein [Salmonella enterica subsp. enterica serovar Berlin]|nr:recombinase family protein [Salmonella enterica]EBY0806381.1 recombinase family protein [Salmonella enterica subsp. enterica serovar Berlin]
MKFYPYHLCKSSQEAKDIKKHPVYLAINKEFSIPEENVAIEIDGAHRRILKELINDIGKGDTIILTDLNSLGENIDDVQNTLFSCFKKDINVYCYHPYSRIEPSAESCMSFLISVQTRVDIQNLKSTRSKYRTLKKPLGRKEGSKYKLSIYTLKLKGYKQSQIAQQLGISLSTVKRHWSNRIIG